MKAGLYLLLLIGICGRICCSSSIAARIPLLHRKGSVDSDALPSSKALRQDWFAAADGNESRKTRRRTSSSPPSFSRPLSFVALSAYVEGVKEKFKLNDAARLALAGAMAGGFSNLLLFPIDVAKTLRQSNPSFHSSSLIATLVKQARSFGALSLWAGLTPAVLGSMPSSALYFGVYESMKRKLGEEVRQPACHSGNKNGNEIMTCNRAVVARRWLIHVISAASGNTASSLIFVPKEVLKQQMQTFRNRAETGAVTLGNVLAHILKEKGILGLYSGYRATLLRNIPSAVLRFTLYEEFKLAITRNDKTSEWLRSHNAHIVAGALAGAISSAVTTPLDVVKTRMALNACPVGSDVVTCLVSVAQTEGVPGLYAGLGFRVLYSALFTAVGFASFEASKMLLGVQDDESTTSKSNPKKRARR